jgi:hypothetical protein
VTGSPEPHLRVAVIARAGSGNYRRWGLQHAAHNGLVAGSSPAGTTTHSSRTEVSWSLRSSPQVAGISRANTGRAVSGKSEDRAEAVLAPFVSGSRNPFPGASNGIIPVGRFGVRFDPR